MWFAGDLLAAGFAKGPRNPFVLVSVTGFELWPPPCEEGSLLLGNVDSALACTDG
jgi:hypothetical protein